MYEAPRLINEKRVRGELDDGQGLGGGIGIIDRANKTFHICSSRLGSSRRILAGNVHNKVHYL
jgi:hypothetical protein